MATYPTTSLQPGMTGTEVKQLQDYLVSTGYMTQTQVNTGYGIYGPQTTAAVSALQQKYNVDTAGYSGYWGPKTLAALTSSVAPAPPLTSATLANPTNQTINTVGSPSIGTNYGDIQATITGITNQLGEMSKTLSTIQTTPSAPSPSTEKTGILDTLKGYITQRQETAAAQPTSEELVNKALAQYGITPQSYTEIQGLVGQLTSYNTQLADLQVKKQAASDAIANKPISSEFITQEQAVMDKRYNSEIAAVSAQAGVVATTIQLKQGLIQDARTTAGLVIDAMTYDQEQKLADMDWAITTYGDLYNIMSKDEQQTWDNAYKTQQDTLTTQQNNLATISDLILETNGQAGILWTDDVQTATTKAAQWSARTTNAPVTQGDYYWDATTGTWKLIEGEPTGGITKDQEEAVRSGMDYMNNFTTREEAFQWLDKNNDYFRRIMGEQGYVQLRQAAENAFPQTTETSAIEGGFWENLFGGTLSAPASVGGITSGIENLVWTEEGTLMTPEKYAEYKKKKAAELIK